MTTWQTWQTWQTLRTPCLALAVLERRAVQRGDLRIQRRAQQRAQQARALPLLELDLLLRGELHTLHLALRTLALLLRLALHPLALLALVPTPRAAL